MVIEIGEKLQNIIIKLIETNELLDLVQNIVIPVSNIAIVVVFCWFYRNKKGDK